MTHVVKMSLVSLAIGFICVLAQDWLGTQYLSQFLSADLLTILIALLAINSTTTGLVLTKIRELVEKYGKGELFANTRNQMVLAVREQVGLIVVAVGLLTCATSPIFNLHSQLMLLINAAIFGVFVYALHILYDTAISVLLIIDFKP